MCSRPSPSLCVGRRCPGRSCPNADSNALLRTLRVCDRRCALHFLQSVNVVRRLRESLFGDVLALTEVLELAGEVAGRRRTHRELFVLVPDFREGAERLVPSGQDSVLGLEKVIAGDLAGLLFGLSELLTGFVGPVVRHRWEDGALEERASRCDRAPSHRTSPPRAVARGPRGTRHR